MGDFAIHDPNISPPAQRGGAAVSPPVPVAPVGLQQQDLELAAAEYTRKVEAMAAELAERDMRIEALEEQVRALSSLGNRGVSREVELINAEHLKALGKLDAAEDARIACEMRVHQLEAECHRLREALAGREGEVHLLHEKTEADRLRLQDMQRQVMQREKDLGDAADVCLAVENDLREQVRVQGVQIRKLEAEVGGSAGEIHAHRTAAMGAESRLRAVTQDAEARYLETHHTVEQMRRTLRSTEHEAASLRERLGQRDEEIKALQMSNAEWLRQFRKQRKLLAEKMIEADYLRNTDTSEVALAQLDMTPAQASRVRESLNTPRAERIRATFKAKQAAPFGSSSSRTTSPARIHRERRM